MSRREDRYYTAVALAHLILDGPESEDEQLIGEAVAVLRAEIDAGRQSQAAFSVVTPELFDQELAHPKPRLVVVDSAGFSVRVPTEEGAA